jgi:hypothetical protein
VQAAIDELIDDLATGAVGSSGASRVGVDAAAGTPNALPAGSREERSSRSSSAS